MSYDGARTWRSAPRLGDRVLLRCPRTSGTVSLGVHLTDSLGNTPPQAVFNAYRTRPAF
ncbi:hypothetical protein ACIPPJ_33395 [Streptomyces sp. NPDC086091]|uniref:hypothetical protein n=1 Tax=Streptomyces sp. NPDC086091 TaxID=3365751 RepID=UPI00382EDB3E